jgi:APA family basic amino acid/polyamine antiporter
VVAALTGLSYAELTTAIPRAAAEFEFVHDAFGSDRLAFLVGWILVLSNSASLGTVALGFAGYLYSLSGLPISLAALALILVMMAVNIIGIRESTAVNVLFTVIETGGLALVSVAATSVHGPLLPTPVEDWSGAVEGAALIFFAYLGFEEIAHVSEETVAPERLIPVAITISVVVTALLYVGIALAALVLVPPGELADALAAAWGQRGREVLNVVALFATANTVLLLLTAGARMLYGMAVPVRCRASWATSIHRPEHRSWPSSSRESSRWPFSRSGRSAHSAAWQAGPH